MRTLLFRSASALPMGQKFINPTEFIRLIRIEAKSQANRSIKHYKFSIPNFQF
jgi:hypothetical protein